MSKDATKGDHDFVTASRNEERKWGGGMEIMRTDTVLTRKHVGASSAWCRTQLSCLLPSTHLLSSTRRRILRVYLLFFWTEKRENDGKVAFAAAHTVIALLLGQRNAVHVSMNV